MPILPQVSVGHVMLEISMVYAMLGAAVVHVPGAYRAGCAHGLGEAYGA